MDLFDYQETIKLVKNRMTTRQHEILNFLKNFCLGKKNAIRMKELAVMFDVSDREIREEIKEIRKLKPSHLIIASSSKGYYIPFEEEVSEANKMLLNRWLGATETLLANDGRLIKLLFWKLDQMKDELDTPLQSQTVMQFNGWEKDINYYADKYFKNEKENK